MAAWLGSRRLSAVRTVCEEAGNEMQDVVIVWTMMGTQKNVTIQVLTLIDSTSKQILLIDGAVRCKLGTAPVGYFCAFTHVLLLDLSRISLK